MLAATALCLLTGYPVAFVLSGVAILFALLGDALGVFDMSFLSALPNRIYGTMTNELLLAVPLFVLMGNTLQKANIAEDLLETMTDLFRGMRAGLGLSVIFVGALLAASTGIVGATVVTMGLISLPVMQRNGYCTRISTGLICASGTLGQIIPPSIVLILLGDQLSSAYQTAQMSIGNLSPEPVSVADLFVGALIPGLLLVIAYATWMILYSRIYPDRVPPARPKPKEKGLFLHAIKALFPPLILIFVVLGSILGGFATPTESAAVGAVGAMIIAAAHRRLTIDNLRHICRETSKTTCMVFTILIGAAVFTLVFRGFGGEEIIHGFLTDLPGGLVGAMLVTMLVMFVLGFFLDFIEIIFVVVPIVAPILLAMGANPIWLGIMIAINLQTSFLTPPFGFALFYIRGVADKSISTLTIYKGVVPFVVIQLLMLVLLSFAPKIATYLPEALYDKNYDVQSSDTPAIPNDGINFDSDDSSDVDF
jgi:tripartite ATP-independent transporter DctM subunit